MAGEEIIVFWVMVGVFAMASMMFLLLGLRSDSNKHIFNIEFFVSFITTMSYVTMALALGTTTALNGDPIYWTRWLYYIASCSLLAMEVALLAGKSRERMLEVMFLTGLVMFNGFLASYITILERWWFFGLSSVAFIGLILELFYDYKKQQPHMKQIMWIVIIGWSLFPLVWVLAPTGFAVIPIVVEVILYALLDIITKIGFGIYVIFRVKKPTKKTT